MAKENAADQLREMALHRGYKLVRSRRRKPGTGDYGKYGLTDAAGKPLLGIGEEGLTATPEDVEAFLRSSAEGTWRESAAITADRLKAETPSAEPPPPAAKRGAEDNSKPSSRRPTRTPKGRSDAGLSIARRTNAVSSSAKRKAAKIPEPEPQLMLRAAKPADANRISNLISQLRAITIDAKALTANLAHVRKCGGGVLLAEKGEVVGCCAWLVVPTLHRGPVGRLTTLLVDEGHRRRGIGRAMLDKAMAELDKRGVAAVEAMSDIDLRNAHNFFRSCGFEQTSYRFVRKAD